MTHTTKCRICGNPVAVECADDYPGDAAALLCEVTCNRCYDLRDRRERYRNFVVNKCMVLSRDRPSLDSIAAIRAALKIVLGKWAQLIAEAHRRPNTIPATVVETYVEKFMRQPAQCETLIKEFRTVCRNVLLSPACPTPVPAEA